MDTPFAATKDGRMFVEVEVLMPLMVALAELPHWSHFDGDDRLYMRIDEAIDWCERECENNPDWQRCEGVSGLQVLNFLKRAKHNFRIGERNLAAPVTA